MSVDHHEGKILGHVVGFLALLINLGHLFPRVLVASPYCKDANFLYVLFLKFLPAHLPVYTVPILGTEEMFSPSLSNESQDR